MLCAVVFTDYRPVPLQHYLFPAGGDGLHLVVDGKGDFRDDSFQRALAGLGSQTASGNSGASARGSNRASLHNGGGGKKAASRNGSTSDIYRLVKMIMERNYEPVICFAFAKREVSGGVCVLRFDRVAKQRGGAVRVDGAANGAPRL